MGSVSGRPIFEVILRHLFFRPAPRPEWDQTIINLLLPQGGRVPVEIDGNRPKIDGTVRKSTKINMTPGPWTNHLLLPRGWPGTGGKSTISGPTQPRQA